MINTASTDAGNTRRIGELLASPEQRKEASMSRMAGFALAAVVACGMAALPSRTAAKGLAGTEDKGQKKISTHTHNMTGCLQKGDEPNTYKLTNIEGKGPKTAEIAEMAKGVDLAPHVGHKVTISGEAISAREAAKAEGTTGAKDTKEERGEHHVRADAVKMISTTCP